MIVLALAACGGGRSSPRAPIASTRADAGPTDAPDDVCGGYYVAVSPFLGRVAEAADEISEPLSRGDTAAAARGARALAALLDEERPTLESLHTGKNDLDAAHLRLIRASDGVSRALLPFADALDGPDEHARDVARDALTDAFDEWGAAAGEIHRICPQE